MPTIKDKLNFNYDGISSRKFNLINVNLDSGMYEESFVGSRDIVENKVSGRDKPYFNKIETSPKEFDLVLAFTKEFNEIDIDEIMFWLFQNNYKPLYFEDNPEKIYYCIAINDSSLVHNGLKQGYITIRMRCDSHNSYSPVEITPEYTVNGTMTLNILNQGHVLIYPEVSIKKIGIGHVTITKQNGGIFEVRDLVNNEGVYIDCEKEIIESDLTNLFGSNFKYLYNSIVGKYKSINLDRGVNTFTIQGNCIIKFRYIQKYNF